jgi:D-lactate dehydrogenase (cytochrome)
LTVVLADGDMLRLRRGEAFADEAGVLRLTTEGGRAIAAKVPTYRRPRVRKNVSGYYNDPPVDAIDLFIGSEGTLGVITEIEPKLLKKPEGFFSGIVFFEKQDDLLGFVE